MDKHLGPRLADVHQPAKALFFRDAAKQEVPDHHDQDKRQQPAQQAVQKGIVIDPGKTRPRLRQVRGQRGVDPHGGEQVVAIDRYLQLAADLVFFDQQVADFLLVQQLQKLTVGDALHHPMLRPQKLRNGEHDKRGQKVRQVPLMVLFHDLDSKKGTQSRHNR